MPSLSPHPSDDIYMVIKSLLSLRANSTCAELLKDYDEIVGDNRLPRNFKDLRRLLQSIPEVKCIRNDYGLEMWEVRRTFNNNNNNKKSEYKFMKNDKPRGNFQNTGPSKKRSKSNSRTSSQTSSFTAAQPQRKRQRFLDHNITGHHRIIDLDGYINNYQLMGDDFMLSLAKIDLGFKWTKDPKTQVLRIGYCISGMSIKELSRIVRSSAYIDSRVVVYIGSVDILSGHKLDSIINDYFDLVSAFRERGIEPLLCTLAPLGDPARGDSYDGIVNGFNCWLESRKWRVIDINRCFIDDNGQTIRSVYQKDPRNVTGCNVRHLLWNKLGRQRVLKKLKNSLLDFF
uniref:CSON007657 protein n=1 Tax=Culicoides sonorensis TaxID=179676 RepID=A0A336KEW7_CULSO